MNDLYKLNGEEPGEDGSTISARTANATFGKIKFASITPTTLIIPRWLLSITND